MLKSLMMQQLQPEESSQALKMSSSNDLSSPEALEQLFQQLVSQLPMDQGDTEDVPSLPDVSTSQAKTHGSSIADTQKSTQQAEQTLAALGNRSVNPKQLTGAVTPLVVESQKQQGITLPQSEEHLHNLHKIEPSGQEMPDEAQLLQLFTQSVEQIPDISTAQQSTQQAEQTLAALGSTPVNPNQVTGGINPLVVESQKQQENFLPQSEADLNNLHKIEPSREEIPDEAQLLQLFTQSFEQIPLNQSQLEQTAKEPLGGTPLVYGETPNFYFLPSFSETIPSEPAQAGRMPSQGFNVEAVRQDFPALHQQINGKPLIWMDNAATSQKPQMVIDALAHFYQNNNSNVHRGAHTLAARATNAYEEAREKIQRFLGAGLTEEIIYVRGTTEGINLVAQTFGRKEVKAGDDIILSTVEHHSNIVPWQMLAEEKSAVLKVIPINDHGEVILEEYEKLLSEKTRIVALSQVSNVLGTVLPIKAMTEMAHRHGAVVLVDGAQSVPHLPVNMQDLDADFFVFSGHKLFGPTGIGVLYGKAALLEAMPPWQTGGNMIDQVSFEKTTFNDIPNKFEAGTGNIADAVGLGVAIDYLNQIGFESAIQHEEQLLNYAIQGLNTISKLHQIGTALGKVSTLSFVIEGVNSEDMGKFLDSEGIAVRAGHHCAQPTLKRYGLTSAVRPSLAFYNTFEEVDALIAAIEKGKKQLSLNN